MYKIFFQALIVVFSCSITKAQEFRAEVKVNAPALQVTDAKSIKDLEKNITEFINNQKWTDDEYSDHEKIKVNIQFNIVKELSINNFLADVSIRAIRPVFGSDYETSILAVVDDAFPISYEQYKPLEMTKDDYNDNLSSFLSYYLYLILGLDGDSFADMGGQEHFETANKIVNSIPPSVAKADQGWGARKNRYTRYWLAENYLNPKVATLRKAFYLFHRKGLDLLSSDIKKAKFNILKSMDQANSVNRLYPSCYAVRVFANTKGDELMEIFEQSTQDERSRMHQLLLSIDPSNAPKYNSLVR